MVIISVIIVFVVINYLIVISLTKAEAKADRELKEIHKAFSTGSREKRVEIPKVMKAVVILLCSFLAGRTSLLVTPQIIENQRLLHVPCM